MPPPWPSPASREDGRDRPVRGRGRTRCCGRRVRLSRARARARADVGAVVGLVVLRRVFLLERAVALAEALPRRCARCQPGVE